MIQHSGGARFLFEASEAVGVFRERSGEHLYCDVAAEARVARAVDLAHAARAEWGDDFVGSEA
jgi:hypothetical protein